MKISAVFGRCLKSFGCRHWHTGLRRCSALVPHLALQSSAAYENKGCQSGLAVVMSNVCEVDGRRPDNMLHARCFQGAGVVRNRDVSLLQIGFGADSS